MDARHNSSRVASPRLAIFLAAPFDRWMKPDRSALATEHEANIRLLIDTLEQLGHRVSSSHRREAFGVQWMEAEECTPLDFEAIQNCDLLIAIPGVPPSGGVHVEIGWASAFGKQVILLLEHGQQYSSLIEGLHCVGAVRALRYSDMSECLLLLQRVPELAGTDQGGGTIVWP